MAGHLVLSETTVKTHVSNLLTVLGCDRVQAVVMACERCIVKPSTS